MLKVVDILVELGKKSAELREKKKKEEERGQVR